MGLAVTEHTVVDTWIEQRLSDQAEAPILAQLAEVEAAARAVYVAHGLPDQPGHYARSPKTPTWRFLSSDMTAEERWALILAQKQGSDWRFGSLEDLGDQVDSPPDLRRAAKMLRTCRRLRSRLADGNASLGEDLEAAIGLGLAWRQLTASARSSPVEPLKLTAPVKARAKRKPGARSKT